jgi:hypothetical protein
MNLQPTFILDLLETLGRYWILLPIEFSSDAKQIKDKDGNMEKGGGRWEKEIIMKKYKSKSNVKKR